MRKFIQALQPGTAAIAITLAFIIGGAATAPNAYAQKDESERDRPSSEQRDTSTVDDSRNRLRIQQREALETKKQELKAAKEAAEARLKARHEARQDKLSASKLEICKNREKNINNRIARIADRSTKHLQLFTDVSERAQTFYAGQDSTLANYDELVTDVTAKKAAAESAVASIAGTTASFDCEGENPKVTIEEFKTSLKAAIEVLKEYRTSVKNLIVGIKSATNVQSGDDIQAEGTQ